MRTGSQPLGRRPLRPEQRSDSHLDMADLSWRGSLGVVKRALKQASADHVTNIAAALAYYAFLAIPSALLLAAGLFSLVAGPHAVTVITDKLGDVMPAEATSLLQDSLSR